MKRFEKAYKTERKNLLKYIKSRISNLEDAEDILHDVFYQAVKNQNTTEPINNIISWLYRITKNRIIDWYRKKKHKTVSLQTKITGDISLEDLITDSGINIEQDFLRSLVFDAIFKCIDLLPAEQRDVFLKRELKGISYKEISEETEVPVNTLLARKRYANMFLQKQLVVIRETISDIWRK